VKKIMVNHTTIVYRVNEVFFEDLPDLPTIFNDHTQLKFCLAR
jgi:hypothetical protein